MHPKSMTRYIFSYSYVSQVFGILHAGIFVIKHMFVIKMIRVSEMLHIPFGFVHNLLIQVLIKKEVKLFLEDILVLPKAKPLFC